MEIRRDYYLNKLILKKHNGFIKVVTGMRRCGKSNLLFSLFKKHLQNNSVPANHMIEVAFDSFESKKLRDLEFLYPHVKEKLVDEGLYYIGLTKCRFWGNLSLC